MKVAGVYRQWLVISTLPIRVSTGVQPGFDLSAALAHTMPAIRAQASTATAAYCNPRTIALRDKPRLAFAASSVMKSQSVIDRLDRYSGSDVQYQLHDPAHSYKHGRAGAYALAPVRLDLALAGRQASAAVAAKAAFPETTRACKASGCAQLRSRRPDRRVGGLQWRIRRSQRVACAARLARQRLGVRRAAALVLS